MAEEPELKSAYELAQERLRERDQETGVEAPRQLTDEQKREIARLRQEARAKLAEIEILHGKHVASAAGDPEKLLEQEQHRKIDQGRAESALEAAIARVRRGATADREDDRD